MRTVTPIILAIIGIMLVSILAGCDNKSNTTFVDIDDEIKASVTSSEINSMSGILPENDVTQEDIIEISSGIAEIEKTTSSVNENDLFLYEVISNRRMFISVNEDCQKFLWKNYNFIDGSVFDLQSFDKEYTSVDLDGDDNNELVINLGPIMVEIFDYQEGEVYGYQLPFRSISNITQGGKCLASDYGWYNITFDKNNINKHYFIR